ncbi:MAG TPA: helix-turn-helix domain-containing GNAT family N-acetyltransferase [Acidobacteriaceae bacterium]|nr:helix-turn-helix domain-containing GNAT family N-acetyltransferase [Acidobacteriaceae bacterium]
MAAQPSVQHTADTGVFRRFTRMYTRLIGTLNEGILGSDFSLAEGRVLYELATRPDPRAAAVAAELEIDPAYLSRILAKFERNGLLKRKTSGEDARAAALRLTATGRAAFRKLNDLSDVQAQGILERLPPGAAAEMIRCMRTIQGILQPRDPAKTPLVLRPHRVGDMGWIVHREGLGYATQFGWDETFEALVAKIVEHFITHFDPARERCWIAEIDGENVGHIFLVRHPEEPGTAKLRLLFVEPSARGRGVGEALVTECIRFARSVGYRKVVLWTQSMLKAAHRIYERAGFRLVKEEPHHSFGHDLVGQEWELELETAGNRQ